MSKAEQKEEIRANREKILQVAFAGIEWCHWPSGPRRVSR